MVFGPSVPIRKKNKHARAAGEFFSGGNLELRAVGCKKEGRVDARKDWSQFPPDGHLFILNSSLMTASSKVFMFLRDRHIWFCAHQAIWSVAEEEEGENI